MVKRSSIRCSRCRKLAQLVLVPATLTACSGATSSPSSSSGPSSGPSTSSSVPAAPFALAAMPGDASVQLTWSAVAGATSYNIYWSTTAGVSKSTGTEIANVTSPYTVGSLTNGTPYYFIVTAANAAGESKPSPQLKVTPTAPLASFSAGGRISDAYASASVTPDDVAINDAGMGQVVWTYSEGTRASDAVWAAGYDGGAWSAPIQLDSGGCQSARVAVDVDGNAFAVWEQYGTAASSNTYITIDASRFDHATHSWSTPVQISTDTTQTALCDQPDISVDNGGNAMAVWQEGSQVWARRYDSSSGWSASATQLSNSPGLVYTPEVVVDGQGSFTAVWLADTQSGGTQTYPTVYARRDVAGIWNAASTLIGVDPTNTPSYDGAERNRVDVSSSGHVFVVWEQGSTLSATQLQNGIGCAHYDPQSAAWSAPRDLATSTTNLSWPQVAVDDAGDALVTWEKDVSTTTTSTSIRGLAYTATTDSWGTEQQIDPTGGGPYSDHVLAMDGDGNAEVLWLDAETSVVERRYDASSGTGWGTFSSLTPAALPFLIAMSDSGYALVFGSFEDTSSIPWTDSVWGWVYTP